jgi:hypothetical protein
MWIAEDSGFCGFVSGSGVRMNGEGIGDERGI